MKIKIIAFLLLVFLLALAIRLISWPDKALFGYEQGRDALVIGQIIKREKFTLIGPKTDLADIFHGVFYYYLMALPYFIGNGNPAIASLFLGVFSFNSILALFFLIFLFFWLVYNIKNHNFKYRHQYLFLAACSLVSLPSLVLIKEGVMEQFFLGTTAPMILIFSHFLIYKFKSRIYFLYGIIGAVLVLNFAFGKMSLSSGRNIFYHTSQSGYYLEDQLKV